MKALAMSLSMLLPTTVAAQGFVERPACLSRPDDLMVTLKALSLLGEACIGELNAVARPLTGCDRFERLFAADRRDYECAVNSADYLKAQLDRRGTFTTEESQIATAIMETMPVVDNARALLRKMR